MPYCTLSDITDHFSEEDLAAFTDDDDGNSLNENLVSSAIARADAEIDATLDGYLTVPFTTVPDMIKYISADLAYFFMYRRRFNAQVPDWVRDMVNDARGDLARIAAGDLTVSDDQNDSDTDKMLVSKDEDDRLFTNTKLDAYFEGPF